MEKIIENNQVVLCGEIVSSFGFSHAMYGEGFYTAMLATERTSGQKDIIPVMVSERLVDVKTDLTGKYVRVSGQFRSFNQHGEHGNRLILSVFVREFDELEDEELDSECEENCIFLEGYICKQPKYRKTPLGREIADILIAVNRAYGKSDYIPCIAWGRNARFVSSLEVGTKLQFDGRIQSREYNKRISDDEIETRTAYEVSINCMEVLEDE